MAKKTDTVPAPRPPVPKRSKLPRPKLIQIMPAPPELVLRRVWYEKNEIEDVWVDAVLALGLTIDGRIVSITDDDIVPLFQFPEATEYLTTQDDSDAEDQEREDKEKLEDMAADEAADKAAEGAGAG